MVDFVGFTCAAVRPRFNRWLTSRSDANRKTRSRASQRLICQFQSTVCNRRASPQWQSDYNYRTRRPSAVQDYGQKQTPEHYRFLISLKTPLQFLSHLHLIVIGISFFKRTFHFKTFLLQKQTLNKYQICGKTFIVKIAVQIFIVNITTKSSLQKFRLKVDCKNCGKNFFAKIAVHNCIENRNYSNNIITKSCSQNCNKSFVSSKMR